MFIDDKRLDERLENVLIKIGSKKKNIRWLIELFLD